MSVYVILLIGLIVLFVIIITRGHVCDHYQAGSTVSNIQVSYISSPNPDFGPPFYYVFWDGSQRPSYACTVTTLDGTPLGSGVSPPGDLSISFYPPDDTPVPSQVKVTVFSSLTDTTTQIVNVEQ